MRFRQTGVAAIAAWALAAGAHAAPSPAEACNTLNGAAVSAREIGLPTKGAKVVSTELIGPGFDGAALHPEYCRVLGTIDPIDATAPSIRFELDLPSAWNGKSLMMGGGGFDGAIPPVSGAYLYQPPAAVVTPLLRGYATFGSDSGHQARPELAPIPAVDGAFAANDEALRNWAGDALKKTSDAAQHLIRLRYGQSPWRRYFVGGSNGGRQALRLLERWPADVDGAVAAYPFRNAVENALAYGAFSEALAAPGGYLDPARQALVQQSVVAACDADDGLADGLISNLGACRFDVATLACPEGVDRADCLTPPQLEALRRYEAPLAYRVGARTITYPGVAISGGADLRGAQQLNVRPPSSPPQLGMPTFSWFWDGFARYAIARDETANALQIAAQIASGRRYGPRVAELAELINVDATDLSAFRARSGKLIIYHGAADALVSFRGTVEYWRELEARMGRENVRTFARFYVAPGFGHGDGGANAFDPQWDPLSLLELWSERGVAPSTPTAIDKAPGSTDRSRPLCEYPTWPRFEGGNPNAAASFRCVDTSSTAP
ncbi:tannase/feruloyl esterase family alpha/beta hydrolase [Phenylobacterium sp.]|uniref:tannase/feruloyl esterase family alpha/beta hydrolase n=1 Tax=Phenylobacterium sp. TaxID=1871053 RepID=UPI00301E6252